MAGFIEQSETVEDAVRRETWEESGVVVGAEVQLVGSQPWPIGAAGHAELMLGCIARATSETINMDETEMDDCRWFTREEVLGMLERSHSYSQRRSGDVDAKTMGAEALVLPPPFAIAHHLVRAWATDDTWPETKAGGAGGGGAETTVLPTAGPPAVLRYGAAAVAGAVIGQMFLRMTGAL